MKLTRYLLPCLFCWFVCASVSAQDLPRPADDFYKKYPVYQKFYPFGIFGGIENIGYTSHNIYYMDEDRGYRFSSELLRENYMNFIWGAGYEKNLKEQNGRYVLDKRGQLKTKWMKELDIYVLPTFWYWFATKKGVGEVFKELKGKNVLLSDKELDEIIKKHRPKFEAMRTLQKGLGDRMVGIVPDDEPASVVKSFLSSVRALKRFIPNLPVTTVTGPSPRTEPFLPYLEVVCSESYGRQKWNTRDFFLRYYRHSPNTVVWNDILTGSYEDEPTLPGLPDGKPTRGEVRLAYWQSLAGGAKGFVCYLYRLFPTWWVGSRSFCNQFGREVKNNNLSVMREIGRDFTAIGPLLLSCRPVEEDIKKIRFQTHAVNYLEFKGPALDCGVLTDRKDQALRYIVVYNNNIDADEKGSMTLPEEWMMGAKLFDLHALKEMGAADGKATFPIVTLRPGEGRIYLVAKDRAFQECKSRILTHRTRNELIRLDIRVRELRPIFENNFLPESRKKVLAATFPDILRGQTEIRKALERPLRDPEKTYGHVLDLIAKADTARNADYLGMSNKRFRAIEDAVVQLDDMIECHPYELFGYTPLSRTFYLHVPKNKHLMFEYRDLIVKYFASKNTYWRGVANSALFFRLNNYAREARELLATYKKTVAEALAGQRQPSRVLFITPQRNDLEFFETFAWLYKNFPAEYGRVKPDGSIINRSGKRLSLDDFDILWLHGVRTHRDLPKEKVKINDVLPPLFLRKVFTDAVKAHVQKGKSLMLTGLFAGYLLPLGLETTMPNVVQDQASPGIPMLRGFAARPGFSKHPVFQSCNEAAPLVGTENYEAALGKGTGLARNPQSYFPRGKGTELRFDPKGFYTSGHHHKLGHFCECTWNNTDPKGRVIADVYDSTLGTLTGRAGIVEYGGANGQGKVLVAGAMPFDLSPGQSFYPQFTPRWKRFIRSLSYNMLCYLGSKETFTMDEEAAAETKLPKKDLYFMPVTWKFRLDPDNKGVEKSWFKEDFDDSGWDDIKIAASWESQGYDYNGYAWYRVTFKVPERFKGKKISLHFGGVDEIGHVYLDGKHLGRGGASPAEDGMGWATPFHFDISDKIRGSAEDHQITVRVHDSLAAGGIWKPVYLVTEE